MATPVAQRGRRLKGIGLIGALAVTWGLTYVAIDVALDGYDPALLSWIRVAGGVVALLAVRPQVAAPALRLIRRRPAMAFLFGGLNLALPFWLIAAGQQTVSSGVTAVLLATSPALVAIVATTRGDASEGLGPRGWLGVAVATLGVALIVGASPEQVRSAAGVAAILGAAGCYAGGSMLAKSEPLGSTWEQAAVTMITSSVLLAAPGLAELPAQTPGLKATAAVAALALIGTALSLVLLFYAVRYGGAGYSLRPIYLSPAVSIAGAALLLGDPVGGGLVVGFLVAITGVAMITERPVTPSGGRRC
jgi:drug/metabolite transporter (DMT)-like permease